MEEEMKHFSKHKAKHFIKYLYKYLSKFFHLYSIQDFQGEVEGPVNHLSRLHTKPIYNRVMLHRKCLLNAALCDYKGNKQLGGKKAASISGEGIFIPVKIKPTWLL